MIVSSKDADARLNSPLNLANRLKDSSLSSSRNRAMSLFVPSSSKIEEKTEIRPNFNPFKPKIDILEKLDEEHKEIEAIKTATPINPTLDNLIENPESVIKLGLAHDKALSLLTSSLDALSDRITEVKADKLASVVTAAAKTVEGIRKERNEAAKAGVGRDVHYHFYTPTQNNLDSYEIIDVAGTVEANPG